MGRKTRRKRPKRYSVALSSDTLKHLQDISSLTDEPISAILARAVDEFLETDEDLYWVKLAEEREGQPTISLEEAWKDIKSK